MRKKWTVQTEITESLLQFRQKRKWQIALRRYVLNKQACSQYAPFFGIDNENFRQWIALQFDIDTNWDNFSSRWQFDHIVPVAYFNFENPEDMKLCWNFVNIRVEKCDMNKNRSNRVDVLAAKSYFEVLYERTNYDICRKMVEKIETIEVSQIRSHETLENFILAKKEYLETLAKYTPYDFEKLNSGCSIETIEWEKAFLKRYE